MPSASMPRNVPRPVARLWLTLALGVLGALLLRLAPKSLTNPLALNSIVEMPKWLAAAFAAVLLLHYLEKTTVPRRAYGFMSLALLLSLLVRFGLPAPGLIWLTAACVLVAGSSAWGVSFDRRSLRQWAEALVRAPAIALAAPFLLFASRPVGANGSSPVSQAFSKAVFAVFPHTLGIGLWLWPASLILLYEWPTFPAPIPMVPSFFFWTWAGCGLIHVLTPWPENPRIPLLRGLPTPPRIGPVGATVFMAIGLLCLTVFAIRPAYLVVTGNLFAKAFSYDGHYGGDPGMIHSCLESFTLFGICSLLSVASARWMSDTRTRFVYWALLVVTILSALCLSSFLTVAFYKLLQYIQAMGFTPRRVFGVIYAVGGATSILAFVAWVAWIPRGKRDRRSAVLSGRPTELLGLR